MGILLHIPFRNKDNHYQKLRKRGSESFRKKRNCAFLVWSQFFVYSSHLSRRLRLYKATKTYNAKGIGKDDEYDGLCCNRQQYTDTIPFSIYRGEEKMKRFIPTVSNARGAVKYGSSRLTRHFNTFSKSARTGSFPWRNLPSRSPFSSETKNTCFVISFYLTS